MLDLIPADAAVGRRRDVMTLIRDIRGDASDTTAVRELFWEYLQWANEQNAREFGVQFDIATMLEEDMRTLDKFSPPRGRIVIAIDGVTAVGLGCLRGLGPDVGEIKRMYVRPSARRAGVGRALLDGLLAHARSSGYARVRLDSAGYMTRAHALYRLAGFREIGPYPGSEIPEDFQKHWIFMEREIP